MSTKRMAVLGILLSLVGASWAVGPGASAQVTSPGELFPGATGAAPEVKTPPSAPTGTATDVSATEPDTVKPKPPIKPKPPVRPPATVKAPIVEPLAPPPPPPPPPRKVAVPAPAAVTDAIKLVNEVYKTELATARTPELKATLAKRLLEAGRPEKDAAAHWAIICKARDLAVDAGDVAGLSEAIDELNASFETDALKLHADALILVARNVRTPEQRKELVAAARRCVDVAIAADRYDIARSMSELGLNTARATSDTALIKDAAATVAAVKEVEAAYADARKAADTLATKPADPEASFTQGKFRCYYKGDWHLGLPLLANGADKLVAELAKLDLTNPDSTDDQVKVGDGWWDLSQNATSLPTIQLQRRAAMYYSLAVGKLSGLAKARLEKRLKEIQANQPASDLAKPDAPDAVAQILARIPPELLPTKDDTSLDMSNKSSKLQLWMSRNLNIDRSVGTSVSVAAKFSGSSVYNISGEIGVGSAQRLSVSFQNQIDFKGTRVSASLSIQRPITGTDDPDYKLARTLDKEQRNTLLTIDTRISSIYIYMSRPYTVSDSTGRSVPLMDSPPTMYISMTSSQGEWTVKPRATPEK